MRAALLPLLYCAAVSAASAPTPCGAPPGVVPVVPEGLCYTQVVPTNPSGITIRTYGLTPTNATLVAGFGAGAYLQGVQSSIASALNFFAGNNDEQRNILAARIVPFMITPPAASGRYFTAHLGISPEQFPDDFLIPRPLPNSGVTVTRVSANINTIAAFQFNTTGFPYLENFQEACGSIQNSTLPKGWAINTTSAWSPTYVFYNGMSSADFQAECWMAVFKL